MRVSQEAFPELMKRVLALKKEAEFSMHEKTTFLLFMIHCFQSLEDVMVRAVMLPLVSLPLWRNLSPGRLQLELRATPALEKHWKNLAKKDAKVCVVDWLMHAPPSHPAASAAHPCRS
jgi:intron-binding protein aquarius